MVAANYLLTVEGVDTSFSKAVEAFGSAEAVLSKAAGEERDMFSQIDLPVNHLYEKLKRASEKYPALMFRFIGGSSDDNGNCAKKFFRNGRMADVRYHLAPGFPPESLDNYPDYLS
jgi:hypothetical protein